MSDLFKALKPKANLSKNGFDLSRKHVFSSKAGQCLPVLALETVPGDYHEIDVTALSRSRTMNTAAFLRGKQRFDFFFVPYTQLWHPFNQFITQRDDKHSTRQLSHTYAPVISLADILIHILEEKNNDTTDIFDFDYGSGMIRILDLLGYGDFRWLENTVDNDPNIRQDINDEYGSKYVNVFRLAAYQHIWYDYYRNKYYDVKNSGGIGAYNSDLDPDFYLYGFNFDDLDCSSFGNSQIRGGQFSAEHQPDNDALRLRMLLKLNYIQWKKDLFTSALPSQQFGAVSSVDLSNINIINNSVSNANTTASVLQNIPGGGMPANALYRTGVNNSASWSIPSAFDVLSLRKAEALQAWKQNTLRAGNMTDDSFKAHFGVEPYYDNDENVHYLGSVSSSIQVNSVEATAATGVVGNGAVGDLAATGTIVVKGNKISFNARDYGIIMCIASFLPESEYSSNCIDKANTLHEQFDWFTPEFQNIGLEPVLKYQQDIGLPSTGSFNDVLGYSPRYALYKTAVDKVFGEFKDTNSVEFSSLDGDNSAVGTMEAWVAPRTEYFSGNARDLATFYVTPKVLDNIFSVNSNSLQVSDQFIHNVYFDIKSIRPMSVLGLPQF